MKKSNLLTIKNVAMLLATSMIQLGCSNAVFSSNGSNNKGTTTTDAVVPNLAENDLVFIDDSFERDDIFMDIVTNAIYGWRGFVLEGAVPTVAFQVNGAGSSIPAAGLLGPAADGNRFLLMNGRSDNGTTVETLQVITQSYDLSQFNTAIISFKYLTFGLNDADDTVPETLQLQVCRGTLNECGANDDVLDPNGLIGDKWVTVFSSDTTFNDAALNGKNHTISDWRTGVAAIDLNDKNLIGDSSTFVMRFVSIMKDGYKPGTEGSGGSGNPDCKCECDKSSKRSPATEGCKNSHHASGCKHDRNNPRGENSSGCKHGHHKPGCSHQHPPRPPKKPPCSCDPGTPADGTLLDGVAIDQVHGVASPKTIEELL